MNIIKDKIRPMKINRFEDIVAWQKARRFVGNIYSVSGKGKFSSDWGLRDQIRRSAVSIASNIADGYARRGDREFVRFLSISNGSISETKSHLYLALDLSYVTPQVFDGLCKDLEEISRLVKSFEAYLSSCLNF